MNNVTQLQKWGGIAAIIEALTYIVGFGIGLAVLGDYFAGDLSRSESVEYLIDKETIFFVWTLIIYVINGIFLVILAQALGERLKGNSPALAQTTAAFGYIWAGLVMASGMLRIIDMGTVIDLHESSPSDAMLALDTLTSVEEALGGGIEIVGGIWVLLVSWAALGGNELPKFLNYLGLIIGVAGIVTVVPALADFAGIFGLGFIVWFLWVGVVMLRSESRPVVAKVANANAAA